MQIKMYSFLIHCILFHVQYKFVMAIYGPNARQANNNEFPGLASIMSLNSSEPTQVEMNQKCTGTLVSRQDIITADHCLQDTFREGFKVLLGSIDLAEAMEFYPMFVLSYEQWILHRQRTLRFNDHDITIIKLLANVPPEIEFSPIGNIASHLLYGSNAQITGWGRIMNLSKPRILHTATVRIMSKNVCQNRLFILQGIYFNIDDRVFCTDGNPYAIFGHGDSGGPLIYFGSIIGINNGVLPAHDGAIQPDQINIHLNLRFYYEYIQDVIANFHMHE